MIAQDVYEELRATGEFDAMDLDVDEVQTNGVLFS
jgi:hypothetical protein